MQTMILQRITPKWVLVMLATCFAFAISILIWLGCYAQPAKDDYLSAVMFRDKGLGAALTTQYALHNGRLASAVIMWCSPLQWHSFTGYKIVCIGFVLLFALAIFLTINTALKDHLHVGDRLAVFFAVYVCINNALGNFAEFYYWLPSISCYGVPFLCLLLLIKALPKALRQRSMVHLLIAGILCFLMPFFSETGAVMAIGALFVYGYKFYEQRRSLMMQFAIFSTCIISAIVFAALSPGNAIRLAATPYVRSLPAIVVGGIYATMSNGFVAIYHLFPAALMASILLMNSGTRKYGISRKKLLVLLTGICVLWFAAELLAGFALGGLPPLRLQNSLLLFIVFFIPVCFIFSTEEFTKTAPVRLVPSLFASLSALWVCCSLTMPGNVFRNASEELIAGIPQQYNQDMKRVYEQAPLHVNGRNCKVDPVQELPSSLYISQPLILSKDTVDWPYFNVQMARYFGCRYLYTDSLAIVPNPEEAFHRKLSGFRHRK